MKFKLLGLTMGALLLAAAMPAGAATFDGSTITNDEGSVIAGDPALVFAPANLTNGSKGINGASFTSGQHYFDYIFKFTLTGPADVTINSAGTVGTTFKDYHSALYSTLPSATGLFFDTNSGLNINLSDTTNLVVPVGTTTLTALNLASGSYFLHLFGVIAGNSGPNSHLFSLGGTFTAAAVAPTPIPAGLPMFATALGALGFMVWRRKTAAPTTAV